ncbi:MAG: GNAT family N-acetyltransferase [Thermodesulfobacteriota bacterium]
MKYEIVKYCSEFKSQIVELQTHLWSPNVSVNAAYLEWKYERNPYVDSPLIYVALCEGKVVGMRGMYGAKWQIGHPPQPFHALCAGDLVIAPEHQNRGLFTKIMRVALNDLAKLGYTYVFNLTSSPITRLGSLTMGWRSIGYLQTMRWKARHRIIWPSLKSYMSRLSFPSSAKKHRPFYFLDTNGVRRRGKTNPYVSVEQIPRPEAMAELVERIGNDGRIQHVRDQEYFAWRFNNPLSLYRFLFWEDTMVEGYLVLQTGLYEDKVKVNIVDCEAANPRIRVELLKAAIHLGNFDVLTIWSATLSDEAKILLQDTGFNYSDKTESIARYRPTILVRPVRDEMLRTDWVLVNRQLLDLTNWDLRMIYSEGF